MLAADRRERYEIAVALAQVILCGPRSDDDICLEQALVDIRDEVRAGRLNQALMPAVAERVARMVDGHSMKVRPELRLVTPEQFDDMVKDAS